MPHKPSHLSLEWRDCLLTCLAQSRGWMPTSELVEKLAREGYLVSKRSVQRALEQLSRSHPITREEGEHRVRGKTDRWRWTSTSNPTLAFRDSPAAAFSWLILGDLVRELLPKDFCEVIEPRIEAASRTFGDNAKHLHHCRSKFRFVSPGLHFSPAVYTGDRLKAIQQALVDERAIEVEYLKPSEKDASVLRLNPLGLVQVGPVGYLVATAFQYKDPRLYALHRIRTVRVLSEPVQPLEGFSLDQFIASRRMEFGGGDTIQLQATVDLELAYYLEESRLSTDQNIKQPVKDGPCRLTATVADSWQLRFWLLSQGEKITVEKPARLRREIVETLTNALSQYGAGK
jgi:hypothetical protein